MNDIDELPVFPTPPAPGVADPAAAKALFDPVLEHLAEVVDIADDQLGRPTPCQDYDVAALRHHVIGWLQFFAAALNDPEGVTDRIDPESWVLEPEIESPAAIVQRAGADIARAIDDGVADRLVTMSQARMAGDGVLAMALGEYLVHGWDLALATGRDWQPAAETLAASAAETAAAETALAFLHGTVAPEYRGPDSGFFGHEVEAPAGATAFIRLLCFAGRQPDGAVPTAV